MWNPAKPQVYVQVACLLLNKLWNTVVGTCSSVRALLGADDNNVFRMNTWDEKDPVRKGRAVQKSGISSIYVCSFWVCSAFCSSSQILTIK